MWEKNEEKQKRDFFGRVCTQVFPSGFFFWGTLFLVVNAVVITLGMCGEKAGNEIVGLFFQSGSHPAGNDEPMEPKSQYQIPKPQSSTPTLCSQQG